MRQCIKTHATYFTLVKTKEKDSYITIVYNKNKNFYKLYAFVLS